ncbi:undecaprenyldiphospho-muramoylpentapeptide beta-N-acetylglucosaminyltransferase [Blastococcus sp. Marseille-P5729]|uniref:undecaprenyldiphospho-muramoylpentapeptide beta-N-acetylglucosaminyltransferase n=1 Tax=Blastococcus sp. Marseille-P5729 TaxID=2086582 RepID=UPI000D0E76B6|nr:undecaprenyldiphospho-muramoylpentapeptide beta-N-acetylglucosaminyltransferase [Blastococcus sp. Marseille-P5729]
MSRHIVLTGGGTAGHIEPMLATAAALQQAEPGIGITCIGSEGGLETTLVPERGFTLRTVAAVPLPRKPSADLLRLPFRLRTAVRQAKAILRETDAVAVVGFGGYASLPSYLAARSRKVPVVVHEANATAGIANKIGARWAAFVGTAAKTNGLADATIVGMPIRAALQRLDRSALRAEGLQHFGLREGYPTLLVYGGSQGARTLNNALTAAADRLHQAGVQVLHSYGRKNTIEAIVHTDGPAYVALPYIDRMDLAYSVADLVLCRAGMGTVAEVSAVGLPAVYVPLPHGNGEQRLNAEPVVQAGGGLLVDDAQLTGDYVAERLIPLLQDRARLDQMAGAARSAGHAQAADVLAAKVLEVARHD